MTEDLRSPSPQHTVPTPEPPPGEPGGEAAPFVNLPLDAAPPSGPCAAPTRLIVDLEPGADAAVRDPLVWWTAVFCAFVHRYTGDEEITLLGDGPGEGALVYRFAVDGGLTLDELAERTAAALARPAGVRLGGAADGDRAGPAAPRAIAAIACPAGVGQPLPDADVGLLVSERGVALLASTDLWRRDTIARMARHLATLASAAAAEPATPIAELPLLAPGERARMLRDWNDTAVAWPPGSYLDLIAEHVHARPDADALVGGGRRISFAELDRTTNRIAARLRRLGAAPGERVGLCAPRSVEFVLGALGVLKTGAAVVPLDPVNPDARIAYMLLDARPLAVLATPALLDRLPDGTTVLALADGAFDGEPDEPVPVELAPETISHLIYTSGSTGNPKAVLERHEAIVNLVHWTGRAYGVRPGDRASWLSTPGFAVQIMEWMPYLGLGVPVHVGDPDAVQTPEQIRDWLVAEQVTHTMLVAALAERAWKLDWPAATRLRVMVTTGERVHSWPPVDLPFRVVMTYGSTETTNVLTCLDIGAGVDLTASATPEAVRAVRPVPVGVPIANLRVYVLDAADHPVPVGVVGRLHVAGAGLAAGYHERLQLTRAKFRPNPLPEEPSPVLYDSGDLARYRADGAVELLGRPDAQVKVRGFRVELAEVEIAVAAAPGVAEAAVLAREYEPGDNRLVAYVAPDPGARPAVEAIRAHVARGLPYYMVPTIVLVDALPRLPNGKVDLRALRSAPPAARATTDGAPAAPRTDLEAQIADLWASLFGVERVGVHDDFFALGGHSLLAFRLVDMVRATFGAELTLPELKRRSTVAQLAEFVATYGDRARVETVGLAPLVPDPEHRHDPFPLTDTQQALWIGRGDDVDLGNVGCHGYFEWESDRLDVDRFRRAWRRLVERHDALRLVFLPDGTQRVLPEAPEHEIEVLDLRAPPAAETEARLAELRDHLSHQVLPHEGWPLFDVRLTQLPPRARGERRVRLHLTLDMLVVDAWSYFQVLVPDLVWLYEHDRPLPPLGCTFRDYVVGGERSLQASSVYERSRRYWLERLDDLPPAPRLPARPAGQPSLPLRFDRRGTRVDAASWRVLRTRAREIGVTASGVLSAAFAEVLRAWSGQERCTINFPLFNRLPVHADVDRLLGVTTTTLLLAVDGRAGTFAERAQALQQQLWSDLEHRYFSGVRVLREMTRRRGSVAPTMPVVMTSLVDHPPPQDGAALGETIHSVSQSPQVALDFQVFDAGGGLRINWDFLPPLFPDGLVESMFEEFCALLRLLVDDPAAWQRAAFDLGAGAPAPAAASAAPPAGAAERAPEPDDARAWERFWSGIERTGRGGDVLWDVDSDEELRWCVEQALAHMDRELPLVDIGCGNGRYSRAFAAHFPRVLGVDVARSAVERAAAESAGIPGLDFRVLDATRQGAVAALADELGPANVFVRGVLHILDDAGRLAFARGMRELLGERGALLLMETAYGSGSGGYLEFVGGGRAPELIFPLAEAGVRLPSHFGRPEVERCFPAGAWEHVAGGAVELHAVDPESDDRPLLLPGFYAVVRGARSRPVTAG